MPSVRQPRLPHKRTRSLSAPLPAFRIRRCPVVGNRSPRPVAFSPVRRRAGTAPTPEAVQAAAAACGAHEDATRSAPTLGMKASTCAEWQQEKVDKGRKRRAHAPSRVPPVEREHELARPPAQQ
jgi:hypothetical protein